MKKAFLFLIIVMILTVYSCKRAEVADPSWEGPAGFNVLVEGSASPALMVVDGLLHTIKITVRVTDYKGNPLSGKKVLLQQVDALFDWIEFGYFENNEVSIKKTTNSNGLISATFYIPGGLDFAGVDLSMYIRAMLVVDGRTDNFSLPQDYISLLLVHAN